VKKLLWGCLLGVCALGAAGCHSGDSARLAPLQTVQARVVESQEQEVALNIGSTGTVHARQTAVVSAQVTGRINRVLVRAGDRVRAGQPLVVIDDAVLRASMDQAQAGVKAAQSEQVAAQTEARLAASTLERYRQLEAQKSVSPQEMDEVSRRAEASAARLDAVRAKADAAQAQEGGARTMLGYTRLVAPFAGLVTARMADPGTMASPGVPLLQIDQSGVLQLDVTVDESVIGAIHEGMKSPVSIDGASAAEITGTVSEIVPAADPASHSFLVKIDLPHSSSLRAGMYGRAEFAHGVRKAIVIPRSAMVLRGSLASAYVLDGQGIAQLRYVTMGEGHEARVEVLSGISAGEKLVDDPSDRNLSGKRIEAQQ
jgi:RND family efflux transporter MFP subunit